jgi:4'-phosphopantetheinyl transferase
MDLPLTRDSTLESKRIGAVVAASNVTAPFSDGPFEFVVTRLDVGPEAVCAAMDLLSEGELQRAYRFASDRDRRRFAVARAGLREQLAARLGRRPEAIKLVCGAQGKPALEQRRGDPDLRFNVSHCDDVAVYAFSRGREIGVDIEEVRHMDDADDIAMRFFSHRENEAYLALAPNDRALGFFNCWTRKEAFVKALGEGLSHPLDSFDVSLAPGEPARFLRIESASPDGNDWSMESFSPVRGFVAAVVAQGSLRGTHAGDCYPRLTGSGCVC